MAKLMWFSMFILVFSSCMGQSKIEEQKQELNSPPKDRAYRYYTTIDTIDLNQIIDRINSKNHPQKIFPNYKLRYKLIPHNGDSLDIIGYSYNSSDANCNRDCGLSNFILKDIKGAYYLYQVKSPIIDEIKLLKDKGFKVMSSYVEEIPMPGVTQMSPQRSDSDGYIVMESDINGNMISASKRGQIGTSAILWSPVAVTQ